jgi:hypothetical protein
MRPTPFRAFSSDPRRPPGRNLLPGPSPLCLRRLAVALGLLTLAAVAAAANDVQGYSERPLCGDGVIEGTEECDDGEQNSDTRPDACRTDCLEAYCGDGVRDTHEECDGDRVLETDKATGREYRGEYRPNSNEIPNSCRLDCSLPHCGDGVRDGFGDDAEECDDPDDPGCVDCVRCTVPRNDLKIRSDTRLCADTYQLQDQGPPGVLQVTGNGVLVDCRGAVLQGSARSTSRAGVGILVTGSGVVLRNCHVTGYATGIRVAGLGSGLFANGACGNEEDLAVQAGNVGFRNTCQRAGDWSDADGQGCALPCDEWPHWPAPPPEMVASTMGATTIDMQAATAPGPSCRVHGRFSGRISRVGKVRAWHHQEKRRVGWTEPGPEGHYSLSLPATGRYRITPHPDGEFELLPQPPFRDVDCVAGAEKRGLDFFIPKPG